MKNLAILSGILAFALVFGACDNSGGGGTPSQVEITVTVNPALPPLPALIPAGREAITITATPASASIFFTFDDSEPNSNSENHASPFVLQPGHPGLVDIPHPNVTVVKDQGTVTLAVPGYIRGPVFLRAIGMEAQHPAFASEEYERALQIFTPGSFGNLSGVFYGMAEDECYYGNHKEVTVTLTFNNGNITNVQIAPNPPPVGYSEPYWGLAVTHAADFLRTMRSAEFDARTSATISSRHIRLAAKVALDAAAAP